jgi:hypothetical protein
MTITLQLKPEVEERLPAYARAPGVSLETYLAGVIEAQLLPDPKRRPTLEEFEADHHPPFGRVPGDRGRHGRHPGAAPGSAHAGGDLRGL